MILKKDVHNPNDISAKYLKTMHPEKLHSYLGLPGKFVRNYPSKIIRKDGSEREMDWLYLVEPDYETLFEEILINVEFQSTSVDKCKIRVISDYRDYSKTYYGLPVLTVIVILVNPKNSEKIFKKTITDILEPIYIYFNPSELEEKLNNIEIKINNYEELTDDEALDIVFLPMFAPKKDAKRITEKITHLFSNDASIKGAFRNDLAYVLAIMIRKYFDDTEKGRELLNMVENYVTKADLLDVIEYELDYRDRTMDAAIKRGIENGIAERIEEMDLIFAERINEMESVLAKKDAAISEKDAAISEKDAALSEKEAALSEKDAEIEKLKAKLKENGIE